MVMGSTDFAFGFLGPRWNDGVNHVYDHQKAVEMVKREIENSPDLKEVRAGLDGDWGCNNDLLWDGEFHVPDFYSHSIWAKPSLLFIYSDGKERHGGECYKDEPFKS